MDNKELKILRVKMYAAGASLFFIIILVVYTIAADARTKSVPQLDDIGDDPVLLTVALTLLSAALLAAVVYLIATVFSSRLKERQENDKG